MKKLLMLILAVITVFSFAACGEDETPDNGNNDNPGNTEEETKAVTYTIKVLDGDKGVEGAMVVFENNNKDKKMVNTDANGVATYETDKGGTYTAKIFVLSGYEFDNSAKNFDSSNTAIFNVTKEGGAENLVTYTIKVVDTNGNPVAGVQVQLCEDEMCMPIVTTDANGEAAYEVEEKSNYKAKLFGGTEYISFGSEKTIEIVKP